MKTSFPKVLDDLKIDDIAHQTMIDKVRSIITKYNCNQTRLMDILIDTQTEFGYIPPLIVSEISHQLNISTIDIDQTLSFYHFFSTKPTGKFTVFLNNSVVANMMGCQEVMLTFEREAGCKFGEVSPDGLIGLFFTSCIGMSDQEPAALINGKLFTRLTMFRVKEIVRDLKAGKTLDEVMVEGLGDGANALPEIHSMVQNNIRKKGPILADGYKPGEALKKIVKMKPEEVIAEVKSSIIRGRGGAGFPTGMKWEICRNAKSDEKYIFCNADEGEPGTFKDRVILTEYPKVLMEGMAIAGYAVGATQGILYVRYKYKYLQKHLEKIIEGGRRKNYLGKNIRGKKGFDFDIRVQFGAGAYVCGEESALIESAEGKRGEPRDRPPFPVESGYLEKPTIVNNVETLCSIVKLMVHGSSWYRSMGTKESIPDGPPRHVGLRSPCRAQADHSEAQRQECRRRGAGHQVRLPLRLRPRHRRASMAHRRAAGSAIRCCGRVEFSLRSRSPPSLRRSRGNPSPRKTSIRTRRKRSKRPSGNCSRARAMRGYSRRPACAAPSPLPATTAARTGASVAVDPTKGYPVRGFARAPHAR